MLAWAAGARQGFKERDKYKGKYLVPFRTKKQLRVHNGRIRRWSCGATKGERSW